MRFIIHMDESQIVYKESGELPDQFKAHIFVCRTIGKTYSAIVGFYHSYYDNNKGGVYDGIGAYIDWDQVVAWKCIERMQVNCISDDDRKKEG